MKYSLTISDLTAEQAADAIAKLNGQVVQSNAPQHIETRTYEVTPANTGGVEVDSKGMPWDARIHASTKAVNKDGSWKRQRGVDDATFDAVTAEIKNAATQPPLEQFPSIANAMPAAPVAPPVAAPLEQAPVTAPVAPPVAAPIAAPVTIAIPAAPVVPATPPSRDFQGLMQQISKLFADKAITPDYPNTIVARVNSGFQTSIATITDVANDARMVEYAWQCLDIDGKGA